MYAVIASPNGQSFAVHAAMRGILPRRIRELAAMGTVDTVVPLRRGERQQLQLVIS
jgi:hypothetical protein